MAPPFSPMQTVYGFCLRFNREGQVQGPVPTRMNNDLAGNGPSLS